MAIYDVLQVTVSINAECTCNIRGDAHLVSLVTQVGSRRELLSLLFLRSLHVQLRAWVVDKGFWGRLNLGWQHNWNTETREHFPSQHSCSTNTGWKKKTFNSNLFNMTWNTCKMLDRIQVLHYKSNSNAFFKQLHSKCILNRFLKMRISYMHAGGNTFL